LKQIFPNEGELVASNIDAKKTKVFYKQAMSDQEYFFNSLCYCQPSHCIGNDYHHTEKSKAADT